MSHYYTSVFIFLLLSSCGFLMLTSNVQWWKKLFVVCALMTSGMLSYRVMNSVYGAPAYLQSDYGDVLILGYYPDKANKTMYVWIKKHDSLDPLSLKMPYSIRLHKQLQQGRAKHKGKPYRSKIESSGNPFNRFGQDIDDVKIQPLDMIPPKKVSQ